jgi:lipopolysaccharide assembly outer membrane protein LptD (OstA)
VPPSINRRKLGLDSRRPKHARHRSNPKLSARRKKDAGNETGPDKPAGKTGGAAAGDAVEVVADTQSKNGDLFVYEGYVNATLGDIRLQADRVTFNNTTGDMLAEGNVIFDQGADQRVAARRAEINWTTRKGVFWETTGFTNRTQTGEYVFSSTPTSPHAKTRSRSGAFMPGARN